MNRIPVLLLLFLPFMASASTDTTEVSCDSLMTLPWLQFDLSYLPDGFLECMEADRVDLPVMRKWTVNLAASEGSDFTVGRMKEVVDSVAEATGYRDANKRLAACQEVLDRVANPETWEKDSLDLYACGVDEGVLQYITSQVPYMEEEGQTFTEMGKQYVKSIDAKLRALSKRANFCGGDPRGAMTIGFGLKAYRDFPAAFSCAGKDPENPRPVLLIITYGDKSLGRLRKGAFKDLENWHMITTNYVPLVIDMFDKSPLPDMLAGAYATANNPNPTYQDLALHLRDTHFPEGMTVPVLLALDREGIPHAKAISIAEAGTIREFLARGIRME